MNKISATITAIQRFSLHDGPGIRTVVFFKGCPLQCLWCSNPESISFYRSILYNESLCIGCNSCIKVCPFNNIKNDENKAGIIIERTKCALCGKCSQICPSNALRSYGEEKSIEDLMEDIRKDAPFYKHSNGGVTFSGGEATAQGEFLFKLAKQCSHEGIHTALETCGHADWSVLKLLTQYIRLFLFDIKVANNSLHQKLTGVSNDLILENLQKLVYSNVNIIIRIPIVPGFTDDIDNLSTIADMAKSLDIKTIHLLPYHSYGIKKYYGLGKYYHIGNQPSLTKEDIAPLSCIFTQKGIKVHIGG